jgi:uncharacterized protein (DUF362 family)
MTSDPVQERQLSASPFAGDGGCPCVRVVSGDDPYEAATAALAAFDLSPVAGRSVLLKPNAGRLAAPGDGVTTHPEVVAAAIDAFRAAGAAEVSVGESPITGVQTMEAFEATGIAAVARARDCPLIDMDVRPCMEVALPQGEAIRRIRVCPEVFEHDIVVSIPVMKTHMHTGVTLAVKNMKGCLWRRSKVRLHMLPPTKRDGNVRSLDIAIADMATVLRPHFSLIDGTVGMEGLGPSAGAPKPLGVVVAGADAFAADAVACRLMGRDAADVPHLRVGAERGCGVIDLSRIAVAPEGWVRFADPFEAAPRNLSIEFPEVTIHDSQSCSACQSTLLLFLRRYGHELKEYFPEGEDIHIAIGKGHEGLPPGTVCVGNCTACHRETGTFVPGCPPVGSAIRRAVSGGEGEGEGESGR